MSGASAYYPPRATRASVWRYRGRRFRNLLEAHCRPLPATASFLASAAIPGFSFRAFDHRLGNAAMGMYLVCLLSYFVWIGYEAADWMVTVMLSIHVSSISYWIKRRSYEISFRYRIVGTLLLVFLLTSCLYAPLRDCINAYFIPLRIADRVIVTRRAEPTDLRRGDWIAYKMDGRSGAFQAGGVHGAIQFVAGYGLSPVLALPGETVEFSKAYFSVNGIVFPAQAFMPEAGSFKVPEKQWFVWPRLQASYATFPATEMTQTLRSLSFVSAETFVGKPFNRWFWRKQTLDEPL